MPTLPKPKLILVALVVAAMLALPAAAGATLTYTKGFAKPNVFYAQNNGKGAHKVGSGRNSHVSPNGEWIVYEGESGNNVEMRLYSVAAGKSERLLSPWREGFTFAWSPDSTQVAALTGGSSGPATLVVIDVETGKRTKVAKGYFNGVSFSPESDEVVFGVSNGAAYPEKSDIYRYTIATGLSKALSHNKTSASPLWGPTGQIVFIRLLGAKQRQYGPKNELFVMNEDGQQISQLTHTKVDPLTQGLFPIGWSTSGKQLLTEYGGQDTSYAVAVNPVTGGERNLSPGNTETGLIGTAISADGKTVLGYTGGFEGPDGPHPKIVTVPFKGGKQKVLVKEAFEPSWNG
jgi:Tol biopolymer transport system component